MTAVERIGAITVSISAGVASVELDNPSQKNALTR
jgi:hypothetical protein